MNLADHIDKIAKVAEVAGKEFSIEQALDKMEKEWEPINFEVRSNMVQAPKFSTAATLAPMFPGCKVRKCAVPPEQLRSEISFSRACKIPKHWKSTKRR